MAKKPVSDSRPNVSGANIINLILAFIRYDIPFFELGKSSIGKSFTIIRLAEKFRVDYSMLYVGSEKGENIEGVPKLTGVQGVDVLSYLKPYWYPREISSAAGIGINENIKTGKEVYKKYVDNYPNEKRRSAFKHFDFLQECLDKIMLIEFTTLQTTAKIDKVEYSKKEVKALGIYICTCLGYGNFWLILDEIDKVEETDVDKYAPLLHIVRERRLKSWNLRSINNNKGIDVSTLANGNDYSKIFDIIDKELQSETPNLLDTRIIAIGNEQITEEALSRRFITVTITDMLVLDDAELAKLGRALEIKRCIDENVQQDTGGDPIPKLIGDVNLQWQFGFLPRIANNRDEGNYFKKNLRDAVRELLGTPKKTDEYKVKFINLTKDTVLFKLCYDNFNDNVRDKVFQCLADMMVGDESKENESDFRKLIKNMIADKESKDFSAEEIADDIIKMMEEKYPSAEKAKSVGKKVTAVEATQVEAWAQDLCTCIEVTMFNELGKLSQSDINKFLVPKLEVLLAQQIADDNHLNANDAIRVFEVVNDFWLKMLEDKQLKHDYRSFEFDKKTTQEVIYGGEKDKISAKVEKDAVKTGKDSLFGATHLVSDKFKTEAFKNTFGYRLFRKQIIQRTWQTILNAATQHNRQQGSGQYNIIKILSDPMMGDFINNFILDDIKTLFDALNKSNPTIASVMRAWFANQNVNIK